MFSSCVALATLSLLLGRASVSQLAAQSSGMFSARLEAFRFYENTEVDHIQRDFAKCHELGV